MDGGSVDIFQFQAAYSCCGDADPLRQASGWVIIPSSPAKENVLVKPLELYTDVVRPEWIDYNGHMNVAYYVLAFDYATDALWDYLGLTEAYRDANGQSTFAAEEHVTYAREVKAGDPLRFSCQLIAWDAKRIHHFHHMYHATEGYLASTIESMSLCVDLASRRVTEFRPEIQANLSDLMQQHRSLPKPDQLGSVLQVKNPVL